ncbi:MAG: restriction endonuclease [Gemmatimonadaceae bacterium]
MPRPLTFLAAAERVLEESGEPMTVDAITEQALARALVSTAGLTPSATMGAQLAVSMQRSAEGPFVRVGPGRYALRRWVAEGRIPAPGEPEIGEIRVPHFPTYAEARAVATALVGLTRAQVTTMRSAIWEHTGTVEEQVDWSDPDRWIPERLTGEHRATALKLWQSTKRLVNPRHLTGPWLLANTYELVTDGAGGHLVLTESGRDLVENPGGRTVREIDEHEGVLWLMAQLAERGPAATGELMGEWFTFAKQVSKVRKESTARSFLYHRLRNLLERAYVHRSGQKYEITDSGLAWLKRSGFAERRTAAPDEARKLWDLVQAQRVAVRQALRDSLAEMAPYAFEQLVGRLLEAMGYTEVAVTAPAGDRGVDVVGRIALGITEVREVVQVKRLQGNVQRPVLDGLRGSLHRFGAVKGTIISLGGFAKGAQAAAFEAGAAPITLIDGEKLLDLLVENGIGVRTKTIELLEFDAAALQPPPDDRDLTNDSEANK